MEAVTNNEKPADGPKYNQLKDMNITKYFRDQKPPQFGKDDKTKWRDPLFPPEEASLLTEEYINKKLTTEQQIQVRKDIMPEKIDWKRFSDVEIINFHVFEDKIEISDIIQGGLSDCYLLSALAALSQYPDYIFQLVRTKDSSPNGVYEVLLFIDGEWQIVLVDDYFPYEKDTSNLMFTKTNGTELWVILLEKVWAKVNGGYANIVLGQVSDAFQALTGFAIQTIKINANSQKEIWENLTNSNFKDYIMCSNTIQENFLLDVKLVQGHAYSLIKAKEVNYSQKTYTLLQLYNPWGRHEWNGDWSDSSPLWNDELKKEFGKPEESQTSGDEPKPSQTSGDEPKPSQTSGVGIKPSKNMEDGQFFMDVNDYIKYFETIYICNMMYGASLKTFDIPANWARSPLVFTFTLVEDCNVSLSVFFKHWRFNRNLHEIKRPFSLVFARIKEEDLEVEYFDGDYSVRDDIQASRRLLKGKYVVWLYSIAEEVKEENFTFKFRIASDQKSSVVFVGEDTDLKIIKHLILSNRKRIMKETQGMSNLELKEDAEVKKAGLRAFYGINKSTKTQEVKFSFGCLTDIRLLENKYKNVKKTEPILLHPGHDILILGAKLGLEKDDKFTVIVASKKELNEKYEVVAQDTSFWNDLNSLVDAEKLKSQEYSFSSVEDLRFVRTFETMGQKKKEKYTEKDLSDFNVFAAKEVFKLLVKYGRKDHDLTIDQESRGIYMGEKPPVERGKVYYGARINNNVGEIYIGCFRDNRYHLKGKFYNKGVLSYDGEYQEGKREGKGIMISEIRDIYKGTFKDDRKKGLFRIYHENTNSMSVVFMDNDKRYGYAMEVNYPQRNTRIAYYQNDMLITFLVVEYEFFKKAFDLDKFGADDTFPEQFKKSLENKFPI